MPKRSRLDDKIDEIRNLGDSASTPAGIDLLKKALANRNNLLAATAAKAVRKHHLTELIPDITETFTRLMTNPLETDKGCLGKTAIVDALVELDHDDYAVFLTGVRHFQPEPSYGGKVDTAAQMRGQCGQALASLGYPDIDLILVDLLTDPELQPRCAAVNALTLLADRNSELLLRFKAKTGDPDPEVVSLCFSGLMAIAPKRSLTFVTDFANHADSGVAVGALLAIGESRLPEAYTFLVNAWQEAIMPGRRRDLLMPIALVRSDDAFDFILGVITDEPPALAKDALSAMSIYSSDPQRLEQVYSAVRRRNNTDLITHFYQEFGEP